jgi:hypothetical protein
MVHFLEYTVMLAAHVLFAYFGPETVMPVTSVIATVGAIVVMFGKTIFRFTLGWLRGLGRRRTVGHTTPAPHFTMPRRGSSTVPVETSDRFAETD